MNSRHTVRPPKRGAFACLALAGAGLMALAVPTWAQAPPVPFPLKISYNLCQGWVLDARVHPERTTEEQARQKCIELRVRVKDPPTGTEQPLPTAPLTAVEAEAWCAAARERAWWFFDDVLKPGDADTHAQARCEQAEALVDPTIVVPNSWRVQFLPR